MPEGCVSRIESPLHVGFFMFAWLGVHIHCCGKGRLWLTPDLCRSSRSTLVCSLLQGAGVSHKRPLAEMDMYTQIANIE
jgi:hypothetical protein